MAYPNGCIYQRPKSPFWWAKIVPYKGAKPIFESTKRTRRDHAKTYLEERLKDYQMDLGHVTPEQVTFTELGEDLKTDYGIEGRKSIERLGISITHLEKVFSNMRAMEITTARVKRYIDLRQSEGAQNGTHQQGTGSTVRCSTLEWRIPPASDLRHGHGNGEEGDHSLGMKGAGE